MRVVGIDQSYTGFGFSVDGESKKKSFPIARYDSEIIRLSAVRSWFMDWLALQSRAGIDLVVMEGYASNAKYGREMSGELGGLVKLAVYDILHQEPLIVPPNSLKKFISGSGGAKKNTMLMHVYKRWGVEFSDDNQADAFALEKFGEAYLNLEYGKYPQFQIEAVEAVRKAR